MRSVACFKGAYTYMSSSVADAARALQCYGASDASFTYAQVMAGDYLSSTSSEAPPAMCIISITLDSTGDKTQDGYYFNALE